MKAARPATWIGSLSLVLLLAIACGGDSDQPPQATPSFSDAAYALDDPIGDCLSPANGQPIACEPPAMDLKRLVIDQDSAGNLILTAELNGPQSTAPAFTLVFGFDTDRNAATGDTIYVGPNGMAPDVELAYIVRPDQTPQTEVRLYGVASLPPLGDAATLVDWRELDQTRLQATVAPALLNAGSFYLLADLRLSGRIDRAPDNGRFAYPERSVQPK